MERDPAQRSHLLSLLDSTALWTQYQESYHATEVEQLLSRELGIDPYQVMMLAIGSVSNPPLCSYDPAAVRSSLASLKAANVDVSDIWFLTTKRPWLLTLKEVLQRWLDFLTVYGLKDKDLVNFLLRASLKLLEGSTLYQAGQVVSYLRQQLGIKNDFLAKRVFAVWPDVLSKDVDTELKPIVAFLTQLGVEVSDIAAIVCVWPELLLSDVESQLAPFVAYLVDLGCSTLQVAEMLMLCPHLLAFKTEDLFGHRLRSLESIGIGREDVKAMLRSSPLAWLTCSGGVQGPITFLLQGVGLTAAEARQVVLAAPGVLADKDWELERKWRFIQGTMGSGRQLLLRHPQVLAASLMQVLGPRYTFLQSNGLSLDLDSPTSEQDACDTTTLHSASASSGTAGNGSSSGGSGSGSSAGSAGSGGRSSVGACQVQDLVFQSDMEWCAGLGLSLNEFREHSTRFQTDFTDRITQDAAKEFQEELKKLGIYEGSE